MESGDVTQGTMVRKVVRSSDLDTLLAPVAPHIAVAYGLPGSVPRVPGYHAKLQGVGWCEIRGPGHLKGLCRFYPHPHIPHQLVSPQTQSHNFNESGDTHDR